MIFGIIGVILGFVGREAGQAGRGHQRDEVRQGIITSAVAVGAMARRPGGPHHGLELGVLVGNRLAGGHRLRLRGGRPPSPIPCPRAGKKTGPSWSRTAKEIYNVVTLSEGDFQLWLKFEQAEERITEKIGKAVDLEPTRTALDIGGKRTPSERKTARRRPSLRNHLRDLRPDRRHDRNACRRQPLRLLPVARGHSIPPCVCLDCVVHLFDTGWVVRPVLNLDQPPSIPQRPMGSVPVVIRLVHPTARNGGRAPRTGGFDTTSSSIGSRTTTRRKPTGTSWHGSRAEDVRRFLKPSGGEGVPPVGEVSCSLRGEDLVVGDRCP